MNFLFVSFMSSTSIMSIRPKIRPIILALLVLLIVSSSAFATDYYVHPVQGSDSNPGTLALPWKSVAYAMSTSSPVAPGDRVYLRGGTYREPVRLDKSGTASNWITLKNYPNETPIIDGTTSLTGWTKAQSDDTYLKVSGVINPSYNNIYWVRVPASDFPNNLVDTVLFENFVMSRIASDPDQSVGFGEDTTEFRNVSSASNGQTGYLIDTTLSGSDDYWNGAIVRIFLYDYNSNVVQANVSDYVSSQKKIVFDAVLPTTVRYDTLKQDRYRLINHPHILNSPGEFYISGIEQVGGVNYRRIYYWPTNTANLTANMSLSVSVYGVYKFSVTSGAYLNIDGLTVFGIKGNAMYFVGGSSTNRGSYINVKNCTVTDSMGTGIYFVYMDHATAENNYVRRCNNRGVHHNICAYGIAKDNDVQYTGSTNVSFYQVTTSMMIGNKLRGIRGGHGNGTSVYGGYDDLCEDVLMAKNVYYNSTNMAFNNCRRLVVYANLFLENSNNYCISAWSSRYDGYQVWINNTAPNASSFALGLAKKSPDYPQDLPRHYVLNNITYGLLKTWSQDWELYPTSDIVVADRRYNLYTAYNFCQIGYGWALHQGEQDARSIPFTSMFVDPAAYNYRPKDGGATKGAGVSVQQLLTDLGIKAKFPDFDFTRDMDGNTWNATPSLGCYEYSSSTPVTDTTPPTVPGSLTGQADSQNQRITISWQPSSDPESAVSYYKIYRNSNYLNQSSATSYIDASVVNGTGYTYQVSAVNTVGLESSLSNPLQMDPPAITGVSVLTSTTVQVSFDEVLDPTTAVQIADYSIIDLDGTHYLISSASLQSPQVVVLTTSPLTNNTYNLAVNGVEDNDGNIVIETYSFQYDGGGGGGNDFPVSNAGADQVVHDTNRDGAEQISLNGNASSDPDGNIVNYDWSENTVSLPGGDIVNPTVTLSAGVHVITLTVTDNDGATSTDTVTITVNQLPIAQAGSDRTITDSDDNGSEQVPLSASGSSDPDGTIVSYHWFKDENQIASGSAPIVNLTLGTHVITLEVADNRGATATDTVIIEISSPANQPPVANAGEDQIVTDADNNGTQTITLNGSASTDADGTIVSYLWFEGANQIAAGATSSVTLATATHVITLEVTDNEGAKSTDTVTITINSPVNQSPVAQAGADQTVTDTDDNGTEVITLNGTASTDPDGTIVSYLWFEGANQIASGSSTSVTLSTGTHVITLEVTDNLGAQATDTVTIEIDSPANQSPVANAGSDQTLTDADKNGTEQVTLNGSASTDPDGTIQTYSWTEGATQIASGPTPGVTLSAGSHTITLTVTDNDGLTDTDTVTIIVNQLPVAQAGMDQIVSDTDKNDLEVITLNGSASSDPDGTIQTYSWTEGATQIATGSSPTISLAVGTHAISLTVTDNYGATATDTVSIRINQSPVADAGEDQTLTDEDDNGTESVSLDASASSDPDGTITSYLWFAGAQYLGSGQTLSVSLGAGSHTLMLIVSDNNGFVATDTVTIRINQLDNQAPVADAGTDLVALDSDTNGNEPVTLDGSASNDPDGTIVSYVWTEGATQIATGATANLNLLNGEHVITLTATDDDGLTASDTVTVTVNQMPVARAGSDQDIIDTDKNGTEEVFLDASASTDPDGTISEYLWFEGGTQIASGVTATVTLDLRSHAITLKVVDNHGGMATDGVVVSITAPENQPPTANAGTDRVITDSDLDNSEAVTLDGSASTDSDGTIQTYVWTENAAQIATGASSSVTLTQGLHTITLTVTDDGGLTATDTVTIRVNIPPTAQAGPDQIIPDVDKNGSEPVTLSGTGSSDPDGIIAQYLWKEDTTVLASGPSPTVNLPLGVHNITLTVTDNFGGSAADTLQVDVQVASNISETDTASPDITNCSPVPDSIQAPLNSLVVLHVVDSSSGVNSDSVQILMNDNVIYQGPAASYKTAYGQCKRRGTPADYKYTFQSNALFDFDETVNVTVSARDEVGNLMSGRKYSFKTVMRTFGGDTVIDSETSALGSTTEPLPDTTPDITRDNPVTVTDSLGNIWIAWDAGVEGDRNIYLAQMPAGAFYFETRVCVTEDSHDQCNPALVLDGNNRLHLTWQDNRRGNWDIYYSYSDDGINFSAPVLVDDSDAGQITPAIAVDNLPSQRVRITWQDNRWGNQDIYLASSYDNFATKTTKALTTNASDQTEPVIAVDVDNVAYVFWTTQSTNGSTDIYGASLTGDSWAYAPIVSNTANQSQPALTVEPQTNRLHILWVDDSRGNLDVFYAATSGGLPAEPLTGVNIVDDNSSADQVNPALITCLNDNVLKIFTCWQDARNVLSLSPDDLDIYFAESDESFGTNILVTDNDPSNSAQYHPVLGLNSQGQPYLIWIDTRTGTPEIRCVGTTLINPQPLASALIEAATGGVVGTVDDWQQMDSVDDIHLEIPAGALWEDVEVTISRVDNPPTSSPLTALDVIARYEFGPSSAMEFAKSVIITIPYAVDEVGDETVFWYNTQTGEYSQSGISNIERVEFSPTLHGIRYKTTHFTEYVIAQEEEDQSVSFFAGGSSGGCSLSAIPDAHDVDIVGFCLPYVALLCVLLALKLRDSRSRKLKPVKILKD